jgi:hypothetical protein
MLRQPTKLTLFKLAGSERLGALPMLKITELQTLESSAARIVHLDAAQNESGLRCKYFGAALSEL